MTTQSEVHWEVSASPFPTVSSAEFGDDDEDEEAAISEDATEPEAPEQSGSVQLLAGGSKLRSK